MFSSVLELVMLNHTGNVNEESMRPLENHYEDICFEKTIAKYVCPVPFLE